MKGPHIRRLYYSTKEVSDITQVDPELIRLWEETFTHLKPSKSKSGRRLFKPEDVKKILRIKVFKEKGYSDEEINLLIQGHLIHNERPIVDESEAGESQRRVLFSEMQNDLKQILNILDRPIDGTG